MRKFSIKGPLVPVMVAALVACAGNQDPSGRRGVAESEKAEQQESVDSVTRPRENQDPSGTVKQSKLTKNPNLEAEGEQSSSQVDDQGGCPGGLCR